MNHTNRPCRKPENDSTQGYLGLAGKTTIHGGYWGLPEPDPPWLRFEVPKFSLAERIQVTIYRFGVSASCLIFTLTVVPLTNESDGLTTISSDA